MTNNSVEDASNGMSPSLQADATVVVTTSESQVKGLDQSQAKSAVAITVKKGRKSKYALRKQAQAAEKASRGQGSQSTLKMESSGLLFTKPVPSTSPQDNRPRQPPSEESGGVPEPTPEYVLQSHGSPSLLPQPRPILVIIDLNGTLLYRPKKKNPFHFIERPHAKQFLDYCLNTFYVAIWSSARTDNVNKMVAKLLTAEQREKCVVIWAREKFGLSEEDYNSRVQCYKRLTTVWADPKIQDSHPTAHEGGQWDQTNSILVDDSLEKARSEPNNLLEIPEFAGLKNESPNVLPQVHDYLNNLCHQSDVSRYVRENRFELDPTYTLS